MRVFCKLVENNKFDRTWINRKQHFQWVNDIHYYGQREQKRQIVHVVVCEESWEEVDQKSNKIVTKRGRHAWISSKPLNKGNVHERCNLAARHRWGIETGILVEKRHGYQYEHAFSYNWNAMRGYHYLMRLGHFINVLATYSECLLEMVREFNVRGFIKFIRDTLNGRWLDPPWVQRRLEASFQLRFI